MQLPDDEEAPGGIVINPASPLGKELLKWEQHRTELVPRGKNPGNPYVFRPYPRMLYKAQVVNGQARCLEPPPSSYDFETTNLYERAMLRTDTFNRSCQRIVQSDGEYDRARSEGWRDTPQDALAYHEALEQDMGNAAAEAAFAAQRMSTKARAELKDAETQTHKHVTDVVKAPKRKYHTHKARAAEAPQQES